MKRLLAFLIIFGSIVVTNAGPAVADGCDDGIGLEFGSSTCWSSGGAAPVIAPAGGPTYTLIPTCVIYGQHICRTQAECTEAGESGLLFTVLLGASPVGQACLTEAQAQQQAIVTPGQVLRAFRRLQWPSSELIVEPPGGATLVNFATNFHTDNDQPLQQSVTLLGQRVTIEATPATYTWRFGDGESIDTDRPGSAYPMLDIVHDYRTAQRVAASVDTTYTGRYRIGGGGWVAIPDSLTVAGAAQGITVREARPTLVQP